MTLAQLLVVQTHDTAIDQLEHRLATLPEFAALTEIADERAHLESERSAIAAEMHTLERQQNKLEDDVALIEDRHGSETTRLYSGTVTAHKDLEAIQHELETLEARQRTLEDQVLEVMEATEPYRRSIADLDARLAEVDARKVTVEASLAAAQAEIGASIEGERAQRGQAIGEVDAALVTEYESARANCGGVGVSRLVDKTCEGCRLQLSAVEYDRIRKLPLDELAWCDCGRILVRS